jgi:hypothetical protein
MTVNSSLAKSGPSTHSQDPTLAVHNRQLQFGTSRCRRWEPSTASQAEIPLPKNVEHLSLTTLREKLIKIGAKVVRHGRYVTFQLAEVAIPRRLFAEILQLIAGLRPWPAPT